MRERNRGTFGLSLEVRPECSGLIRSLVVELILKQATLRAIARAPTNVADELVGADHRRCHDCFRET